MAAISKGPPRIYTGVIDVVEVRTVSVKIFWLQNSLPEFKKTLYPVLVFRSVVVVDTLFWMHAWVRVKVLN